MSTDFSKTDLLSTYALGSYSFVQAGDSILNTRTLHKYSPEHQKFENERYSLEARLSLQTVGQSGNKFTPAQHRSRNMLGVGQNVMFSQNSTKHPLPHLILRVQLISLFWEKCQSAPFKIRKKMFCSPNEEAKLNYSIVETQLLIVPISEDSNLQ